MTGTDVRVGSYRQLLNQQTLDKGQLIEDGTHETLLKKGGFYTHLMNSYFKLNTKNHIIRINTVFKDYSSIKKAIILPRIYHD